MNGYSRGRIKKIKIQNFMTYDYVELYPKKGLNLIVGLNGSGKSSIMCAICLCLAGKPHFTGRATQLSDFIKHDHQEADIEIELESGNKNNVVIHRKLRGDKCEWTLNKSPSNQNEVAHAVKKFNIDTSNLCQFLPQEKVVEFSRMDKKQRLENMLQAIGEPRLFKLFNELKSDYSDLVELEQAVKKHENKRCAEQEENDKISDEVQKQESRVRLKQELERLELEKKVLIYQEIYEELKNLKIKKAEIRAEADDLRRSRDEASAQEASFYNSYQRCKKKSEKVEVDKKTIKARMNNSTNALIKFKEQVETAKIEFKNRLQEKEDQKKRLHDLSQQIQALHEKLSTELLKKDEYDENELVKSQELGKLQTDINTLNQSIAKIVAERAHIDRCLVENRAHLNSLRNEQNKKMANLKRLCKDTYKAACWLLENRNKFNSNVYLPIMIEINMKYQNYTKYVENGIPFRDIIAFVCEDRKDCERLTEYLKKQQKLPVNIVMAPDAPMSHFASPNLSREHRQYGLEHFITNLFNAPDPVMRYLCACCFIHMIPVTTSVVPADSVAHILETYKVFFSENMKVTGRRSRYGNRNLIVKKDFIANKNFLVNINDDDQKDVEKRCQDYEEEIESKAHNLEVFNAKLTEKEKDQEKLRQEKKFWQNKKREIENLKIKYAQKSKMQKQLILPANDEEERIKMTRKIISINELREKVLTDLDVLFKDFMQKEKEIVTLLMCMNVYSKSLKLTRADNEDIHEKVKAIETELYNINREFSEKKSRGKQIGEELKAANVDDEEMKERIELLLQNTSNGDWEFQAQDTTLSMDEIEQRMNHIQAQLNLNEDNEPIVDDYNRRKLKIMEIIQKIGNCQEDMSKLKQIIQKKKKEWLQPLQHHIGNINKKFSHYFKELNCVGEISLDIPENSDDFTKYGLRINLKFHDDESSLCELSQTRHSGGECSVAAIVFILSLQELTEVPFRCIDEINQGMDSVNERKIYQLIYDSVADDKCSQYFLLTPKLLMDLDYPEDVAVHIIYNSPFLKLKLDVKKHLAIAQSV